MITRFFNNGMVILQCNATKIRYNIFRIKPHTSDTNVEDIKCWELIIDNVTLGEYQFYTSVITLNLGKIILIGYARGH